MLFFPIELKGVIYTFFMVRVSKHLTCSDLDDRIQTISKINPSLYVSHPMTYINYISLSRAISFLFDFVYLFTRYDFLVWRKRNNIQTIVSFQNLKLLKHRIFPSKMRYCLLIKLRLLYKDNIKRYLG